MELKTVTHLQARFQNDSATIPKKLKEYLTPDAESPKQESLKGKAMSLLGFDGKSSVLKAVIN